MNDQLDALAAQAGERWARSLALRLRAQGREIEGAWPGTLSEAYSCVLAALAGSARELSRDEMRTLSRRTYSAARCAWQLVAAREP